MGAYADTSSSMRSVSYEQATTATSSSSNTGFVRPEKVENPYGSTAGAGSGSFHVYRHARAREIVRLKQMEAKEKETEAEKEFQDLLEKNLRETSEKTNKKKKKRLREKEAKKRKKLLKMSGMDMDKQSVQKQTIIDEEEFEYIPLHKSE